MTVIQYKGKYLSFGGRLTVFNSRCEAKKILCKLRLFNRALVFETYEEKEFVLVMNDIKNKERRKEG